MMTEQEAQELLQKKEQEKIDNFQKEYQALAAKYGYGFDPIVTITPQGFQAGLTIVKLK